MILDNLAQDKPTAQSSSYTDGKVTIDNSGYAVDGVRDTHFSKCTRTELNNRGTTNPWWRVDLEQWLPVSEVYILNRGDCCGDRLNGFEIRVGKRSLIRAKIKYSCKMYVLLIIKQ